VVRPYAAHRAQPVYGLYGDVAVCPQAKPQCLLKLSKVRK